VGPYIKTHPYLGCPIYAVSPGHRTDPWHSQLPPLRLRSDAEHIHLILSEPKTHSLSTTLRVIKGESSELLKGKRFSGPRRRNSSHTSTAQVQAGLN
jgi:hypothetical protein